MDRKKKKKPYKFELTGPGLVMWASAIFVLLAWSFVLGVLVGRGSIPDKLRHLANLKEQWANLKQETHSKAKTRLSPKQAEDIGEQQDFDFFKKLAEKREEKIPVSQSPIKRKTKLASYDKKQHARGPAKYHFTVQIASFDSRDKAATFVKGLAQKGISAYYIEANTKKGKFYRVRCGDFVSRKDAADRLKVINKMIGLKGFVCKK